MVVLLIFKPAELESLAKKTRRSFMRQYSNQHPNTENSVAAHLRHLAVETCAKANLFSSVIDPDFINKIYYMVASGAMVTLKEANSRAYTLDIEGIRVSRNSEAKKQFQSTYDPESIATISVRDCGHKMLVSFIIGEHNFQRVFDGKRSGEIFAQDAILIMRQFIELAQDVSLKYREAVA